MCLCWNRVIGAKRLEGEAVSRLRRECVVGICSECVMAGVLNFGWTQAAGRPIAMEDKVSKQIDGSRPTDVSEPADSSQPSDGVKLTNNSKQIDISKRTDGSQPTITQVSDHLRAFHWPHARIYGPALKLDIVNSTAGPRLSSAVQEQKRCRSRRRGVIATSHSVQ